MNKGQVIIGSITTLGFIALTAFYFFGPSDIPAALEKPLLIVSGAWVANFSTIINWLFGSSKGSADKSIMMSKMGTGS